ncbi:L-serine ammonia-lyase, iron-sulfur-dependent, subunit alpha [Anaerosphaera multitolerans]|uniref:L-serine dehydratase n=1 Tax=Anaerosphaera multitolerans TaxID=2487351 RepID=A0A437S952_9FIRM|nr:L-serine ammonia-lyase, iron-sulfur-dependent, subunit alpha [Anaerosphaera multitolerans]RVU55643.1 L-serine ammonia-lyase, iron-sulfur-dependent, subunit alpha [Anaerosphaera multitolerans]
MYNTAKEIIDTCKEKNCHIYDLVLDEEMKRSKKSEAEVRAHLDEIIKVMTDSALENLNKKNTTRFQMTDGFAQMCNKYQENEEPIIGKFLMKTMAMAFSTSEVNDAMGKVVAAPTAGSSGIMPATIVAAKEKYDLDNEVIQNGLLTSIAIGQIIAKYATFAGAEGGCQAECGSASAMAASALVSMLGGTPEQALHAASITLVNILGLVCDPIAGLVQYPCTFRNASGVINAFISADMALAGVTSLVPFDEVTQAMGEVGRAMHESLRETGIGGLAGTKTGKRIRREFLEK